MVKAVYCSAGTAGKKLILPSLPTSDEVKKAWSCTSTHPYVSMTMHSGHLKYKDNIKLDPK